MERFSLWIFAAIFLGLAGLSAGQGEFEGDPPEPGRVVFTNPASRRNGYWNDTSSLPSENRYHHLRDHDPKVTARYGRPYQSAVWRCDLRVNSCFLRNRVKYAPFRLQSNFAQHPLALVLDVGRAARSLHGLTSSPRPIYAHSAARLTSHGYFPAAYADACLDFSYYWNGTGVKSLKVLQRNEETTCVYADEFGSADLRLQHTGQWRDVQIQLDLRYGPAKFVIEFQFDSGGSREELQLPLLEPGNQRLQPATADLYSQLGNIAIRDFSIGYGVCSRNDANECDAAKVIYGLISQRPVWS